MQEIVADVAMCFNFWQNLLYLKILLLSLPDGCLHARSSNNRCHCRVLKDDQIVVAQQMGDNPPFVTQATATFLVPVHVSPNLLDVLAAFVDFVLCL